MKNIFENAKFGDKFRTRDGRMAIYVGKDRFDKGAVRLAYEGLTATYKIMNDGRYWATPNVETQDNIVSEWQEPIDDKELDKLAKDNTPDWCYVFDKSDVVTFQEGFKAGYRKTKQE